MGFDYSAFAALPRVFRSASNDDRPPVPKAKPFMRAAVKGIHADMPPSRFVAPPPVVESRFVPVPPKPAAPKVVPVLMLAGTRFLPAPPVIEAPAAAEMPKPALAAAIAFAPPLAIVVTAAPAPVVIPVAVADPASIVEIADPAPVTADPAPAAAFVAEAPKKRATLKLKSDTAKDLLSRQAPAVSFVSASRVKKDPAAAFRTERDAMLQTGEAPAPRRMDVSGGKSWKQLEEEALAARNRKPGFNVDLAAAFKAELRALEAELQAPDSPRPRNLLARTLVA